MSYDNRGNKISMNDPDMGIWSYTYNALGELIRQTDAVKTLVISMCGDCADSAQAVVTVFFFIA
jgi:YD repeat-containing protein